MGLSGIQTSFVRFAVVKVTPGIDEVWKNEVLREGVTGVGRSLERGI